MEERSKQNRKQELVVAESLMAVCDDSNWDLVKDPGHGNHHSNLLCHVRHGLLVPYRNRHEMEIAYRMQVSQQTMVHLLSLCARDGLDLVPMAHLDCFHERHSLETGLCLEVMMVFDRRESFRFCPTDLCRGHDHPEMVAVASHLLDSCILDLDLELYLDCHHASRRGFLGVFRANL
jgi:hypothetical protein